MPEHTRARQGAYDHLGYRRRPPGASRAVNVGGTGSEMPKVLIVTNDFPPRAGGIQSFVHALATRLPPGEVVVYAPAWEGAASFDERAPFPVVRHPTSLMLPVPTVARRAARILKSSGCDTVLFGAAAPLGLLAPSLRRAGARRIVAITHGHEAGWAVLPGARSLLRRIGDSVDVMTYLGEYTRSRLARALSPQAAGRLARLAPGVDTDAFRPDAGGAAIRERLRLAAGPGSVRRGTASGRRRASGEPAAAAGQPTRRDRLGRVHRPGALGGTPGLLRRGRRVRDAVPHPQGRP